MSLGFHCDGSLGSDDADHVMIHIESLDGDVHDLLSTS